MHVFLTLSCIFCNCYNEQLRTGHFCSLQTGFVITGLICVVKWTTRPKNMFVITECSLTNELVISEFHFTIKYVYSDNPGTPKKLHWKLVFVLLNDCSCRHVTVIRMTQAWLYMTYNTSRHLYKFNSEDNCVKCISMIWWVVCGNPPNLALKSDSNLNFFHGFLVAIKVSAEPCCTCNLAHQGCIFLPRCAYYLPNSFILKRYFCELY